ncbi:MAG: hypothetical protein AAF800_04960 [Planctomycetota bacterium]
MLTASGSAGGQLPVSAEGLAHRQYGPWFSSRLGGGGYWLDTRPSVVAGRWYLWSDVGGFYRSDDDTRTWRALHQNLPDGRGDVTNIRALIEHPDDPDRLVVMTGTRWRDVGGVWASDDGGQTWDKTLTALFWGNADGREFGRTLRIDPGDADTLLAAGQEGVWRSEDFGRSWRKTAAPDGLNPVDLGCDPADPSRWWLSSWAIETWTQGNAFTTSDGFYVSDDRGETWAKIAHEAPREIVIDPTVPGRWIGAFRGQVRESRDGGRSWSATSDGLPPSDAGTPMNIGPAQVQAMTTTDDAVLVANAAGDLFRLPGGGSRWGAIPRQRVSAPSWWYGNTGDAGHNTSGGEAGWVHYGKSASSLSVDPRNPDRWVMTDWYAVWRTEDAGRTWRYAGDGAENTVLHGAAVDPGDPDHLLVFMGDNGILHSGDRGHTLRKLPMPGAPLYSNVKRAVFAPSDDRVVWAIGNTNPGQWESSTVARSTDAGRTWRYTAATGLPGGLARQHFINAIAVDPSDARRAWVALSGRIADGGGVYETRDAGRSWSAINEGLTGGVDLFTANIWDAGPELAVDGMGMLLAVSKSARSVYRYDPTSRRWSVLGQAPGRPDAVAADPHTPGRWWLACGDAGLFVYENETGADWQRVFDRGASSLAIDRTHPGRMALGALDGVHLSDDHGRTWRRADARMPHRHFPVVAIGHDLIVAGTKGNGVFVAPWH